LHRGRDFWRVRTFRMSHWSRDFFTENTPSFERLAATALIRANGGALSVKHLGLESLGPQCRSEAQGKTWWTERVHVAVVRCFNRPINW
jgi:hypothetical protein